ncbi:hypothetical protein DdX_03474 [Ditylenchus destructor]|uniref:Uncharacterized protein n=1 Tax=Ditylenchus destructor TaxID=166010 RepID=A0AAD4NCJ0_9BILA|nr:hypothetical protein DdX_03474 [Ditylenchus destructor]
MMETPNLDLIYGARDRHVYLTRRLLLSLREVLYKIVCYRRQPFLSAEHDFGRRSIPKRTSRQVSMQYRCNSSQFTFSYHTSGFHSNFDALPRPGFRCRQNDNWLKKSNIISVSG